MTKSGRDTVREYLALAIEHAALQFKATYRGHPWKGELYRGETLDAMDQMSRELRDSLLREQSGCHLSSRGREILEAEKIRHHDMASAHAKDAEYMLAATDRSMAWGIERAIECLTSDTTAEDVVTPDVVDNLPF